MKKAIALVLTIAMLCSVTACSKEEAKNENNNETKKTTVTNNDNKETTSKKDKESESTKVVADAETSVDDKETTVDTEDETTSKTDATTGKTESDTKAPATQSTTPAKPVVTEPTTQAKDNTEPTTTKPVVTQPTEPSTTTPATECNHNWVNKGSFLRPLNTPISRTNTFEWDKYQTNAIIHVCDCDKCKSSEYYGEWKVGKLYDGNIDSIHDDNVVYDATSDSFKLIDPSVTNTVKGVNITALQNFYISIIKPADYPSFEEWVEYNYACGSNGTAYTVKTGNCVYEDTLFVIEYEHWVQECCTKCNEWRDRLYCYHTPHYVTFLGYPIYECEYEGCEF